MASDAENWLCASPRNEEGNPFMQLLEGKQFSSVCVPYGLLKEAVNVLPNDLIVFLTFDDEAHTLLIDYQQGQFSMPTEPADDFPKSPDVVTELTPERPQTEPRCTLSLPGDWLVQRMKAAKVCIANDLLRPIMNTAVIDVIGGEKVAIVSTDGHSLFKDERFFGLGSGFLTPAQQTKDGTPVIDYTILFSTTAVDAIVNNFQHEENITITVDSQRCRVTSDTCELIARCPEGRYPNYNSVIPRDANKHVVVCQETMLRVLRRLSIFANEASNMCVLTIHGDLLQAESLDLDFERFATEQVPILEGSDAPDGFRIAFKIATLSKLLNCIHTENAVFNFTAPERATLIKEEDANGSLTLLIMPMKTD